MKAKLKADDFHEIYKKHSSFLLFYLRKLKIPAEDADDIMQESFLRLFRNLEKIDVEKQRGFLTITAKNLVVDRYRKQKNQRTVTVGEEIEPQGIGLWVSDPQRDWEVEKVGHIIDEVSAANGGECFRLFYREGLSLKEIASHLNQPIGTVASHVTRFRAKFQDTIKQRLEEQDL